MMFKVWMLRELDLEYIVSKINEELK